MKTPEYAFPQGDAINQGMTLRDWFAGQAMVGICSMSAENFSLPPEDEAKLAYQRADAMLAAREATHEPD